jgi:hypothetical protein
MTPGMLAIASFDRRAAASSCSRDMPGTFRSMM